MPSFKTPTQQQINAAVQRMRSPEFAAYFLSRLENPKWISPLRKNGLFASPPPAIQVEGGGVQFPSWPASRYLARMATHAPREVAAIFAEIETDNPSVIGNMLQAALAMPPEIAVKLMPAVCRAAQAGTLWIYFKDASDLCVHLADGGEVSAAVLLAEALFTPKFEDGQEEPSRRDDYWYKDGLKKVVPALAGRIPRKFLPKLCDWLAAFVQAKKHVSLDSGEDYSYVWRPAIEEHEQNSDYDVAGVVAGLVSEGFEHGIRQNRLSLDEAIQILDRYPYLVFRRIWVHLSNEFAEQKPELVRQTIMNRALFDDYKFKHEYAMLVGRRLDVLTPEERDTWLGWIDNGPDMSDFDESVKTNLGRDATEGNRQGRIRYWQFQKLHWVRNHLEGERAEFYQQMLIEHGEPELADLNVYIGSVRSGSDSPMSVDDLTGQTFEQAVDAVSSWKPEKSRFMEPDIDGLASTFREYVATDPTAFSAKARLLIERPAIYVRGFMSQMAEAATADSEIDVPAVLDLCRWVVERPLEEQTTPQQERGGLVDTEWQWTRDAISEFIENICKAKTDEAPRYQLDGLREQMWRLLTVLCRNRAASYVVRDVSEEDPRLHDYLTLGINSPRGKAVEAALEYARWVENHIKQSHDSQEIVPGGFNAMPEVREMLEWQIAPGNRSLEALSVIGSHLGLIYWIDNAWLAENAERLFRLEGIEETPASADGWAAWNAFLVWVSPHVEFYKLFKDQFAYAVQQSAHVQLSERTREQPMYSLGQHLVILYGRGQIGLDDDDAVLLQLLSNAQADIRRHTIGFVGQSLGGDEPLPTEIGERFQRLWDVYWSGPGKSDAADKPEAWLFGTWFSCGQFPAQWALEQLEAFVEIAPTPEPDHAVVQELASIAHLDIVRSVHILDRMIRGDREGWRIHGWFDEAKRILQTAMNTGGEAQTVALDLINYLGRRGHTDFGSVLASGPSVSKQ